MHSHAVISSIIVVDIYLLTTFVKFTKHIHVTRLHNHNKIHIYTYNENGVQFCCAGLSVLCSSFVIPSFGKREFVTGFFRFIRAPPTNKCWGGEALLVLACPSLRLSSVCSTVVPVTLTLSFLIGFLLNVSKFEYGFYPTNDNQDGLQHDCPLSVSVVVVTLTQSFFNRNPSRFHIWIASIKLLFKFEYGFCPTNVN